MAEGITKRHSRRCRSRGGRCNCEPLYEAWAYDKKALVHKHDCASRTGQTCDCTPSRGTKIRKSFPTEAAAKAWRSDATRAVRRKKLRAPTSTTLQQAVDEFLEGAQTGSILNRRKQRYKPGVVRNYELALRLRVLPELGSRRLADIETVDLLDLKESLLGQGIADSTIHNTFTPLQAIYRRAVKRGDVAINPTLDLELPTANGRRERAATPAEAFAAIDSAPEDDRALWATAFLAGLRRGELRALRVVDVNETCIHVEHGWDDKDGQQTPKSLAGRRDVPKTEALTRYLDAHLRRTGRTGEDLVFGRTGTEPFTPGHISDQADEAWAAAAVGAFLTGGANVERWTLHEARHTFSTFMDAAGISETRADRYMGHSTNRDVSGRYRHQLAGQLAEDARTLDAYLSGAVVGKVVPIERAAS